MQTLARYGTRLTKFVEAHRQWYAWSGVGVLLASSLWWAALGARLQQGNADQLADGYLFADWHTFSQAIFPASHTLLLKWPLFWLLRFFNFSLAATDALTVVVTLTTVAAFAYLLYRIIRRPLLFGTVCLALAGVLALVPAQLAGGVTAPLGMALLTGRNMEYVAYLYVLVLYIRAKHFTGWEWPIATVLLAVLLASDQLFTPLCVGGAALTWLVAYAWHHEQLQSLAKRWLAGSAAAWLLAHATLLIINNRFTDIGGNAAPYEFDSTWRAVWPAATYAVKALGVNFGITTQSGGWAGLAALFNIVTAAVVLTAGYKVVCRVCSGKTPANSGPLLAVMLLASTAVALVLFVVTAHPYAADARYLTIAVFAGFVALAACARTVTTSTRTILIAGVAACLATVIGLASVQAYTNHAVAASPLRQRNQRIAQALQAHPVEILVGDYWRVLPVKSLTPRSRQRIIPLQGCFRPVAQLRSNAWLVDLRVHRFAYLLSLRSSGTPFGGCSLHMVKVMYGTPTATVLIDGTAHNPAELLLFYDNGAKNLER